MKTRTTSWKARPAVSWKPALQTGVADGEPYGQGEQAAYRQEHAEPARDERLTTAAAPKSRKATPSRTRK
jgi:hypothetical protein